MSEKEAGTARQALDFLSNLFVPKTTVNEAASGEKKSEADMDDELDETVGADVDKETDKVTEAADMPITRRDLDEAIAGCHEKIMGEIKTMMEGFAPKADKAMDKDDANDKVEESLTRKEKTQILSECEIIAPGRVPTTINKRSEATAGYRTALTEAVTANRYGERDALGITAEEISTLTEGEIKRSVGVLSQLVRVSREHQRVLTEGKNQVINLKQLLENKNGNSGNDLTAEQAAIVLSSFKGEKNV